MDTYFHFCCIKSMIARLFYNSIIDSCYAATLPQLAPRLKGTFLLFANMCCDNLYSVNVDVICHKETCGQIKTLHKTLYNIFFATITSITAFFACFFTATQFESGAC